MKKEISKAYCPQEVEDEIYKKWEESGFFNPDNLELSENNKAMVFYIDILSCIRLFFIQKPLKMTLFIFNQVISIYL